jgi:cellulose synthase/poly-beta-1,6-N-acetylglucosamine synthase-like glycosyltransferase
VKLFFEILFIVTTFLVAYSYLIYPVLMLLFSRAVKEQNAIRFSESEELPSLTVVCAAYNEGKVVEQKIRSTFNTNYPIGKIKFLIGTDACSDDTVTKIKKLQSEFPGLELVEFTERNGKINIINKLCTQATGELLVMTDANVFFKPDTFFELTKHFKNKQVDMVCGNVQKIAADKATVTHNELQYMNYENAVKFAEGKLLKTVMGAEGGCYALRREVFKEVPSNFNVDDFFISCLVMRRNNQILFEPAADVFEYVATDTKSEFRRKARIATGNFQNLFYFTDLLKPWTRNGFAYISHKVIRWITPILFLLNMIACAFLFKTHILFEVAFITQLLLLAIPLINKMLEKTGIRIGPLISLSHFMVMNAALLVGLFRYSKGVGSSVWQPVTR